MLAQVAYRKYSGLFGALFEALLDRDEAEEALNDLFAAFHRDHDAVDGSADAVCAWLSGSAYSELESRMTTEGTVEFPVDAFDAQSLVITRWNAEELDDGHNPDNRVYGFPWFEDDDFERYAANVEDYPFSLEDSVFAAAALEMWGDSLPPAERNHHADRPLAPSPVSKVLIAGARRRKGQILTAFLSCLPLARRLGLSASAFLSPFAQSSILGPDGEPLAAEESVPLILSARAVTTELLRVVARHPRLVYQLTPRQFEELLAELFSNQGFEVTLTARTRDGGADLLVVSRNALGSFLYVVEAKRYRPDRAVGVGMVRQLLGVTHALRASAGVLATTSYFTSGAREFQKQQEYQLQLKDFADLQKWLRHDH